MLTDMSTQDSDDSRNYSETVGTRLTPQTKRQFDDYREANELGKTEAARRLIREALSDTIRNQIRLVTTFAALFWLVAFAAGGSQAGAAVGGAYIAGILIWSSAPPIRRIIGSMTD